MHWKTNLRTQILPDPVPISVPYLVLIPVPVSVPDQDLDPDPVLDPVWYAQNIQVPIHVYPEINSSIENFQDILSTAK